MLYSNSLFVLDIGMDGNRFLADVLSVLTAPNLVDLTVCSSYWEFNAVF
jgi:hypothetical protein